MARNIGKRLAFLPEFHYTDKVHMAMKEPSSAETCFQRVSGWCEDTDVLQ